MNDLSEIINFVTTKQNRKRERFSFYATIKGRHEDTEQLYTTLKSTDLNDLSSIEKTITKFEEFINKSPYPEL